VNDTESNFCTSCYTGNYPTDLVQLEVRKGVNFGKPAENAPVMVEREG
jgi:hypothetical protein